MLARCKDPFPVAVRHDWGARAQAPPSWPPRRRRGARAGM